MKKFGIEYSLPKVSLLQDTGIGVAELAARTCYDSFEKSENECVKYWSSQPDSRALNNIESSDLLYDLSHTYFHHSILEHANLSFLIEGTSRGVLQEHSRHRIQAISVRSTRYTMSPIINAFNVSENFNQFYDIVKDIDFLVITGERAKIDINYIYNSLEFQFQTLGADEFLSLSASKDQKEILLGNQFSGYKTLFDKLQKVKQKRNVGDSFKHVVTDNWKVDMVVTFNVRSLRNYFTLRDSGAAYFQIKWLAQAMKKVTPQKYIDLIEKRKKDV